jgi:protein-S-isoprenylcysteine O-methyltransferase Ste14
MPIRAIETVYVLVLFAVYFALWAAKRRHQRRTTGHDPEVLRRASSPLQRYFAQMIKVLTWSAVVLIAAHSTADWLPGLHRLGLLDNRTWDHVGLAIGLLGLAICAIAQWTMGNSWRVGIDTQSSTALVTGGIYRYVRNPTYLGLFLLNAGIWLIWPTCAMALFALTFYILLEVQVRCEEEYLESVHGADYSAYVRRSKRYLPWVY